MVKTIYNRLILKYKYSNRNDFARDIYRFRGSKFIVKLKLSFLKKYNNVLQDIDSMLYQKLTPNDKEVFLLYLFRRWIGGGGVTLPENYSYILFKTNMAFLEAERLFNNRKTIDEPVKIKINNKEFLYSMDCPLPFNAITLEESFSFFTLAHIFLKEYYLEGFNPNDGETIIDCGGATGDTALFFNAFYPDSIIHTFECDNKTFNTLKRNIEINHKENKIYAYKKALGSKQQTLFFEDWHVVKEKTSNSVEIECISVDSFVKDNNINNIGLIKIDVYGYDNEVLRGCADTIKKFKPKLMISLFQKNDIIEIPQFLHSLGLKMELKLKFVEFRVYNVGCFILVKFL